MYTHWVCVSPIGLAITYVTKVVDRAHTLASNIIPLLVILFYSMAAHTQTRLIKPVFHYLAGRYFATLSL
jgi:hypothetical protein